MASPLTLAFVCLGCSLALVLSLEGARGAPAATAQARESWPCYRHDNERSGYTPSSLNTPLAFRWSWASRRMPWPAWPEPGKEWNRMPFDYAFQVSVGRGKVYFGSSSDHKVYALDLATGREVWSFFTEGPVRFAPALAGNRLFAASDDGCVYCLDADSGRLVWRFFGGPRDERVMGNGQMISRWPARSGVVVDGDVVYFTAGMWSTDGVYAYALRAADGKILWKNDTCSQLYMGLPHSAMEGIGGLAPQGYLLLHRGALAVPQGRAMPAAFDASSGKLLYCDNSATKLHHAGGSWVIAADGLLWGERRPLLADIHVHLGEADPTPGEGLIAWDSRTGEQKLALVGKHRAVIHDGVLYCTGSGDLSAVPLDGLKKVAAEFFASGKLDPEAPEEYIGAAKMFHRGTKFPWFSSKIGPIWPRPRRWQIPVGRTYELIMAGDVLIAAGRKEVTLFSAAKGKVLQKLQVPYEARGLAVADGRLLVSCTTGEILCFGPAEGGGGGQKATAGPSTAQAQRNSAATTEPPTSPDARRDARHILDASGVREGYCLLLGIGGGDLAMELARLTQPSASSSGVAKNEPVYPFAEPPKFSPFTIYCPESDAAKIATARRKLDAANLYGARVAVHRVPGPM
ncbi:MAG: PQQ-like beta-propeller repeat protein, partial [Armatimonadetes bacterium]|nr:PQQ-like beta-propeller repeat protein [Armatimonadota bacterium]